MPRQSGAETLAMREKIYMTVQENVIGASTGNYNKLENVPVVNLTGSTEEKYINLSGLNQGHFSLSGYYRLTEDDELQYQEKPIDLYVLDDDVEDEDGNVTPRKVLYYFFTKDDQIYLRVIVVENNEIKSDITRGFAESEFYWQEGEEDTTNVQTKFWRGTTLPEEYVDGRIYYLYDDESMTTFTMYMDRDGVRSVINTDGSSFKVIKLSADEWSEETTEDGGRDWYTQEIEINSYKTTVVNAIACGETIDVFASVEQERALARMKAYLDMGTSSVVFYSPVVPTVDIYVAVEGIN